MRRSLFLATIFLLALSTLVNAQSVAPGWLFQTGSSTVQVIGDAASADSSNVYFAWIIRDTAASTVSVTVRWYPLVLTGRCNPTTGCAMSLPGPVIIDTMALPSTGLYTWRVSLAADGTSLHVVYPSADGTAIKDVSMPLNLLYNNNVSWSTETIPTSVLSGVGVNSIGIYNSAAVDPSGNLGVAFTSGSGQLVYATKSGGTWAAEVVQGPGPGGSEAVSLAYDSAGVAQIAFLFQTSAGSTFDFFARQNGTASAPWGVVEGITSSATTNPIDWMSFASDSNTTAAAYMDGSGSLYYAARNVGSGWHSQLVDTWGFPCCITNPYTDDPVALTLSSAGYPRIAYGAVAGNTVGTNVAFFDGSSWSFLPMNQVSAVAEPLDYLNRVAIVSDHADAEHVLFLKGLGTGLLPELIYDRISATNTPLGSNVTVSLPDTGKYGAPLTVSFSQVTTAGLTNASLTDPNSGPAGPQGFQLSDPPVYYDITTTAQYSGPVTICIDYGTLPGVNPANLELFHYENGAWVNRTSSIDTTSTAICATVSSLSPFAIFINQSVSTVAVPNVVGLTQTGAATAIAASGLVVGTVTQQSSPTVPQGNVISQSPTAGTTANVGSAVSIVVSSGPQTVAVPNVVGMTQSAATTAIIGASLVVGTATQQSSMTVPQGNVISQIPTAATIVSAGSAVSLVVSSGPPTVGVPNVVGMMQSAASTAIINAGLVVGTATQQPSTTVPPGDVISQSPTAGTTANIGSAVSLVVSSGPPTVAVPNVIGMAQSAATTAITSAGLVVGTLLQQPSTTVPTGAVISQTPTAGTTVTAGSAVNLVVSSAPSTVAVPRVIGLTQTAATQAITNAGFSVGRVFRLPVGEGQGIVVFQYPFPHAVVPVGSPIDLILAGGSRDDQRN